MCPYRERRFELGLTQREAAEAAGTSHSAISRLEPHDGHGDRASQRGAPPLRPELRIVMNLLGEQLVAGPHLRELHAPR